ncbi:MAG: autotransporter outer membrane beta-barrel domain-containing protein [Brevundimonas sp.]|uniref:autotransporter outer membrane beta-barrel domain-containing protein n=1 Tax=Brevundimonas sp. TaxID=1871086 RepID=UPI0012098318|nr:autotransporter outer membrane beta-barrel domain-containing protein [Brevundimonas sp.]RZJ17154.1 MAG: autotransporter outer membrane beta-barrel domain-containing protein [Brevundimonas sp.]
MRKLLATAAAMAPLVAATGVQAEVVISTARTTPILTANATGTAPDNIRLANNGSITVTTGAAITLNSSHTVDLDSGSRITMANAADGATGILVNGGNTGSVTVGGAISITDSIDDDDYKDTDGDGDIDGPFAAGTNRHGLRVAGASPFVGDIKIESSGSITVEGNQSYGIRVESDLQGDLQSLGTITVLGTETYGIRVQGDVSGDVEILGAVNARGEDATAVSLEGDVAGAVKLQGAITSTGYRHTTAPNPRPTTGTVNDDALYLEDLDADDLLQGGPAVAIAGNVGGGVLLDKGPAYADGGVDGDDDDDGVKNGDEDDDGDGTKNRDDTDRDGDGILDASEGTSSITTYGAAPALQIGSTTQAVNLGVVGTGDSAYGVINRGSITASGVYAEVDATAVQIGGLAGGQTVNIDGGVRNEGSITSSARDADATGVRFGAGASTPTFINTGSITGGGYSDEEANITGVLIEAGANLPSLVNDGVITGTAGGGVATVGAIVDKSGTLTSIRNTRTIQTGLAANADGDDITGTTTAIDVSANSTGVTLIQEGIEFDPTEADPDTDGDGVPNSREPAITGAIKLGSGADVVDIRNGTVNGDISFGAGADSLSITGGAAIRGAITDSDGQLDINVTDGVLDARQTSRTNVSSLNVGADGSLIVTLDPATVGSSAGFNVSGATTIAEGAGLGVRFTSLIDDPARFTIINADPGSLTYDRTDSSLLSDSPYLFVAEVGADLAAGDVYVDVRRRRADEANLIKVEEQAYDAVYQALYDNEAVRNAFLAQTDREGFGNLFEQMLPDHSGGPLLSLASGVDAVTRALTGRNAAAAPGQTSAWVQEINFYADKDRTDTYGFRSEGFGVAGGVERGTGFGALGITAAYTSSDLEDPEAEAEEVLSANLLELGLYWRAQGQYWTTWARAAGGYASFEATRQLVADGINLKNESDWHGWTVALAGGASYQREVGRFTIRPEVYAEYFSLSEDARREKGGGDGFDLIIDEREGHLFSATAAMNVGMNLGRNGWIRPELRLGWRQNISVDPGETIARFAGSTDSFRLTPDTIEGGGPIVGFNVNIGNALGMLSISGDAEFIEDYVRYSLLLRASFRF